MSWEENVRKVTPYIPGEQPGNGDIIKLNTNECPYPPSPKVREAMEKMNCEEFRLYPPPDSNALVKGLADYYKVSSGRIFVGVGSDDVISMAFLTFFDSDKPLLFPDITYSFYDVWAQLYRIPYRKCPLDDEFRIRKEDYLRENGGIIFPNPNAPTGILEPLSLIEEIAASNPGSVVVVDEAYIDFGGASALPLTEKYDNLLVVQTFSKSRAMAGMRIGFAIGNERLISYINDVKNSVNSYTMNQPALTLGLAAIQDEKYFKETVLKIKQTREWVKRELSGLGFTYPEPWGNFIFAAHEQVEAGEIFKALKEAGIYVRYWNKPRISNYLRITVGTDEEMRRLVEFLKEYLKSGHWAQ